MRRGPAKSFPRGVLGLLVVAQALLGCGTLGSAPGPTEGASFYRATGVRGFVSERRYRIHTPPGFDREQGLPLVVAVHGAFSSPERLAERTGLDRLADSEGFAVAYPEGIGLLGRLRHWNSGHCCGPARRFGIDDVGYLDAVIDDAVSRLGIDPQRIFMVGHSNGGMLVHRYAAERPGLLAATAVVSGTIGGRPARDEPAWRVPRPASAIPILLVHGRDDETVAFAGGEDPHSSAGRTWLSFEEATRFWSEHQGCSSPPRRQLLREGWVERTTWWDGSACRVEAYSIAGWGHRWPGGAATRSLPQAHPLRGFDATAAIWRFFSATAGPAPGRRG